MKSLSRVLLSVIIFTSLVTFADGESFIDRCRTGLTKITQNNTFRRGVRSVYRWFLGRRYEIKIVDLENGNGLETIKARGTGGIIFVFEHPGLIDPPLTYSFLGDDFQPIALIAESVAKNMMPIVRAIHGEVVPEATSPKAAETMAAMVKRSAQNLKNGKNILVAAAGRIKRGNEEDIDGQSFVSDLIKENPDARVVLIRSDGIYGSAFSTGKTGNYPEPRTVVTEATIKAWLKGAPKRPVTFEIKEATDIPRHGSRSEINSYIKTFYNEIPKRNLYVGYDGNEPIYEAPRVVPPELANRQASQEEKLETLKSLDPDFKAKVMKTLVEVGDVKELTEMSHLGEMGIDSLKRVEILTALEVQFDVTMLYSELPQTAYDYIIALNNSLLVKAGKLSKEEIVQKAMRVDPRWYYGDHIEESVEVPSGKNIAEVFLKKARANPDRVIAIDEIAGAKTYRDIMLGIYAMKPVIEKIKGDLVGIMMPPGVGASVLTLATIFAGKTPVMVNYTSGGPIIKASLDSIGVTKVITGKAFVDKLQARKIDLSPIADRFLMAEDMRESLTQWQKAKAAVRSAIKYFWITPWSWKISPYSVVLFTSGSTGIPKAVFLTHKNQLTNIRDILKRFNLDSHHKLISSLPPFHSFGQTVTQTLPFLAGIPTVYTPDPTDHRKIAEVIDTFKANLIMAAPSQLGKVAEKAKPGQLDSLEIAMVGGEALTKEDLGKFKNANPKALILEGYGATEASPIIAANSPDHYLLGSVGKPMDSLRSRILDLDTMKPVEQGKIGMLYIQGDSVFGGYPNVPDSESPLVELPGEKGRWYLTGDLIEETKDGMWIIKGRLKRFRKRGAEMYGLDSIQETVGSLFIDSSIDGPTFAVECARDNAPNVLFTATMKNKTPDEIRQIVRAKQKEAGMPAVSFIDEVRFVDKISTLGTGKTDYKVYQKLLQDEISAHE